MKRLHLHIAVENLEQSIGFYSVLFGAEPSIRKDDYAKWMLEDPKVNLAISQRGVHAGLDHVGIQVETDAELRDLSARLKSAGQSTSDQEDTTCCYSRSNKSWVTDPSGLRWETFFTFGDATVYGEDEPPAAKPKIRAKSCSPSSGCC